MKQRTQNGTICIINSRWYIRYSQLQMIDTKLERRRLSHCLGDVETHHGKHPPKNIQKAAADFMTSINNCAIPVQQLLGISDFIENVYLPRVQREKRPSTYKGYRDIWVHHVRPIVSREKMCLKDVRVPHVQKWLDQIGKENLAANTQRHIKAWLSGVFRLAIQQDYYDKTANPVREASLSPAVAETAEPYAYSLDEINTMLSVLPAPADVVFAVAAFGGLRFAELCGLDWPDYHDGDLWIQRSIWNGHVSPPKTKKSKAPVPVIKALAQRLEMHRLRCGNPQTGPMFANSVGGRLNLNNLLARTMLPALNRCVHCGGEEGKPHLKQSHDWERDQRIPEWRGWHACRRGLASNLNRLGVDDEVIQRVLRHATVSTTQNHYIKTSSQDLRDAMGKFEEELAQKTTAPIFRDSDLTVKPGSGSQPESVN